MMAEDLTQFVSWLGDLPRRGGALATWFDADAPVYAARAPGRLDVMGGIADYSGSLVLQMPIAEAACCAVQCNDTGHFDAATIDADTPATHYFSAPAALLADDLGAIAVALATHDAGDWGAYLLGPVAALLHHTGAPPPRGMRVLLRSHVPAGKGVSSSAAIEVATARAAAAALGCEIGGHALALCCQAAENRVARAPCGVMDQLAATLGREGELLAILCQPAEVLGHCRVPEPWRVWGVDSGVRHAVSGADYGQVRAAAFMGYRYIAGAAGLRVTPLAPGRVRIDDPRWHGHVANVTPSEYETCFRDAVPAQVTGRAFLDAMHGTTDELVPIDPATTYAVRQAVAHPIHEHHRVRLFAALLQAPTMPETPQLLGELMYQSHASYSACGLGSDATDAIVRQVRDAGAAVGLYGAKITGGGSGGTVAVLGHRDAEPAVRRIAAAGRGAGPGGGDLPRRVFVGSSDGAMAVPVVRTRAGRG
ncbi:MAG: galactokinase family protein [Phycisphaeraceae bacterium]